jgi:hypothetical protein
MQMDVGVGLVPRVLGIHIELVAMLGIHFHFDPRLRPTTYASIRPAAPKCRI